MRWLTTNRRSSSNNKLSLQQLEDRATPSAVVTAVTINSLQVGVNQTQRSRVWDVAIAFDSPVTFVGGNGSAAAAFSLNRVSGGSGPPQVNLNAAVNASNTVVTLTFTGGSVDFGSLKNGRYALHALKAQFAGMGITGTGPGDTIAGDDYMFDEPPAPAPLDTAKIFCIFGDCNGDGTVAANDFMCFLMGGLMFDFDGDGAVAASDFIQFRLTFGGSI